MQSLVTVSESGPQLVITDGTGPIGKILGGRYRVVARVGAGGMGQVYLAEHLLLGCQVALKTLAEGLRSNAAAQRRFRQEAELGAVLYHPNLVRVVDFEPAGSDPYLVMDLLEGQDLKRLLNETRVLPLGRAIKLIRDALAGLQAAHERGVIHRDLKPSNLFVVNPGRAECCKVLDFGVARVPGRPGTKLDPLTLSDRPLGTLAYMAPEQIQGASDIDARADVYAAAAILFEVLSGRRLFEAETAPEQMFRVLNEKPPRLDQLDPNLPAELAEILERSLSRTRAERFADAAAFSRALEPFADHPATSQIVPRGRASRWPGYPVIIVVSAALGMALGYQMGHDVQAPPLIASASEPKSTGTVARQVRAAQTSDQPRIQTSAGALLANADSPADPEALAKRPAATAPSRPNSRVVPATRASIDPELPPPQPTLGVERTNPYE